MVEECLTGDHYIVIILKYSGYFSEFVPWFFPQYSRGFSTLNLGVQFLDISVGVNSAKRVPLLSTIHVLQILSVLLYRSRARFRSHP